MRWAAVLLLAAAAAAAAAVDPSTVPTVPLHNAAKPGLAMPVVGLGTGGYGSDFRYKWAYIATGEWLAAGGRRIDTALVYTDQINISKAVADSGIGREELWYTSKMPVEGYNATLANMDTILEQLNTTYVDLLLLHHPAPSGDDPVCQTASGTKCRLASWAAMNKIFEAGKALAIGVSNYEISHLEEILSLSEEDAAVVTPAVNQVEFNVYWHEDKLGVPQVLCRNSETASSPASAAPRKLLEFCQEHQILLNGYSPLGAPDVGPPRDGWNCTQLELPLLVDIGRAHGKTAAQIALQWQVQQGVVVNPRTHNTTHMEENLSFFDITLSESEMATISSQIPIPQSPCKAPADHCCNKVCGDPWGTP